MSLTLLALVAMMQSQPALHVNGANLETPDGHVVPLRGCNLGNWLVIEHWIWDQSQPDDSSQDQYQLEQILAKRFGEEEKDRLMELHRANWLTDRDFKIIKSFRFNVVRLPMNYRQFEDDARPFHLRRDAWKWTDRAIQMASKQGLYVILDMHGAQGGQSTYDHTGRSGQNKLWSVPENQERLAWLWGQIAARYRHTSAVVAYDVFNEPYGGQKPEIRTAWEKAFVAIRKVDPDKLVYAHGRYDGYEMFGDPKKNGWKNVGFQMHYYPGLFGNGPATVRTHVKSFEELDRTTAPDIKKLDVPFLVGEMNVVFNSSGGPEMMRRSFDFYESHNWATTMWTYKALSRPGGYGDANWGMVTNKNKMAPINFLTAPNADIEAFFKCHSTMPYAINEDLRKFLAPKTVHLDPLPVFPSRTTAPQQELPGWTSSDVGAALKGGLETTATGFNLYGGGADIWGSKDQFRFLHKEVTGDFELTARIDGLEDLGSYCKAGLMVRASLEPDAPFLLASVFPSGEVQLASRKSAGADTQGTTAIEVGFPFYLRIARRGNTLDCTYRKTASDQWKSVGQLPAPDFGSQVSCGAVALSHDDSQLVKASYAELSLRSVLEDR